MRRALVAVAAAFCFAVDSASAQSALARVRAGGQLRIGTDATYPPFASAQGGEFSEFGIDLGRAIAREQILFIYFVLPAFGVNLPAFTSGIIALTLNSAAYLAEIFRAGIESIETGQMEAARSLGMTYAQAMRRVTLPQTFRRILPPLTNEGIALLKDSSLVSVIGLTELARTGQELASRYAAPLTIWPMVALLYLLRTFPLTRVAHQLERRWRPVARG